MKIEKLVMLMWVVGPLLSLGMFAVAAYIIKAMFFS